MKEYVVEINGVPHTVQLDEADAKARGLTAADEVGTKAAEKPANKSRTARNKS